MTGFGVGRAPLGRGRIVVEVRSVNHRFLDVRVRAPRELADVAMHLEQKARQRLHRGRFELVLRSDGLIAQFSTLDTHRARAVYESLCRLRDTIAPEAQVPFSMLASVPDIFVADTQDQHEAVLEAVDQALDQALATADAMRNDEGTALHRDLFARLQAIEEHTRTLGTLRVEMADRYREKLRERIQRILSDVEVGLDPSRLEQEIAITAERCDVQEEITRLESHFSQFAKISEDEEPVGRRLDFLLQEMAREINTLGAKSQDASITHEVVEIKAEIERMREQVQNVE